MSETSHSFDRSKLSEEDLAVLRAFEAAENLAKDPVPEQAFLFTDQELVSRPEQPAPSQLSSSSKISDDMLVLFVTEADEDIAAMRQALEHLEQGNPTDPTALATLQSIAHKVKGTAGSIGYEHTSSIAHYIEKLAKAVQSDRLNIFTGLIGLVQAIQAIEATLYSIAADGQESNDPFAELQSTYDSLNITNQLAQEGSITSDATPTGPARAEENLDPAPFADAAPSHAPSTRVDVHLFENRASACSALVLQIEQLAEQRGPLESAQAEVELTLQELSAAQARLQHLETLLIASPLTGQAPINAEDRVTALAQYPTSSLVARILNDAGRRAGDRQQPSRMPGIASQPRGRWDELEIEVYTNDKLLARSLREAIADVVTASSRLHQALAQLHHLLQKHMTQISILRNNALRMSDTHKAVQGLLVRAGSQHVIIPFSQIRHIDYKQDGHHDSLYTLNALLGFPAKTALQDHLEIAQPVLILEMEGVVLQVDAVLGASEAVMKPLAQHLRRPGIAGIAIDDRGLPLLVLDLPALLAPQRLQHYIPLRESTRGDERSSRRILIADDSAYLRQSVTQALSHAGYEVFEARNGVEALELLLGRSIDVALIDIEMPHLNGYELLDIIRASPQLAGLKVIMLTSRSSDKHRQQARELGVQDYLTKPCPQDTLLAAIEAIGRPPAPDKAVLG